MNEPARRLQQTAVQETGTVTAVDDDHFTVRTSGGDYRATRARSCLLRPELNDFVLLASLDDGRSYVLAVLERQEEAPSTVAVDGDLTFEVKRGRFSVAAQRGVGIASAKDVSVVSGSIDVNAVTGNVVMQRLSYLGRYLASEVEKVKTFAGTLDQVLDRFSQRVKRSYRTVEELEQVRAERIDYSAKKNMSLRGHNTLMTAEQLVKVDGEQIHLG